MSLTIAQQLDAISALGFKWARNQEDQESKRPIAEIFYEGEPEYERVLDQSSLIIKLVKDNDYAKEVARLAEDNGHITKYQRNKICLIYNNRITKQQKENEWKNRKATIGPRAVGC